MLRIPRYPESVGVAQSEAVLDEGGVEVRIVEAGAYRDR